MFEYHYGYVEESKVKIIKKGKGKAKTEIPNFIYIFKFSDFGSIKLVTSEENHLLIKGRKACITLGGFPEIDKYHKVLQEYPIEFHKVLQEYPIEFHIINKGSPDIESDIKYKADIAECSIKTVLNGLISFEIDDSDLELFQKINGHLEILDEILPLVELYSKKYEDPNQAKLDAFVPKDPVKKEETKVDVSQEKISLSIEENGKETMKVETTPEKLKETVDTLEKKVESQNEEDQSGIEIVEEESKGLYQDDPEAPKKKTTKKKK